MGKLTFNGWRKPGEAVPQQYTVIFRLDGLPIAGPSRSGRTPEVEAAHAASVLEIQREMGLTAERCGAATKPVVSAPPPRRGFWQRVLAGVQRSVA